MGFGDIIATGIGVIVLIVVGYLILATLASSVDSANASLAAVRDPAADRIHTALAISNVTRADGNTLSFDVTNTGSVAIDDVPMMDVFVLPVTLGHVTAAEYLPCAADTGHDAPDHWYIAGARNALEPGETMTVACEFRDGVPASPVGCIEVAAPDGVMTYQSYMY